MKNAFKFGATLFGAVAVMTGMSSCSKDDESSEKCCTVTYNGQEAEICESDLDGEYTWSQYVQAVEYLVDYGSFTDADCD